MLGKILLITNTVLPKAPLLVLSACKHYRAFFRRMWIPLEQTRRLRNKKASTYAGLSDFYGILRRLPERHLFSNTKTSKYLSEQIIGSHRTGNFSKVFLREA
jgi:hypothetical protein